MKIEFNYKKKTCLYTGTFLAFAFPNHAFGANDKGMFSLHNTDFVVLISFVIFVGILIYFEVPRLITRFLDQRSSNIKLEIDKASKVLEDAKILLSSLEEQHKETTISIKQMISNAESKAKFEEEKSKKYIEDLVKNKLLSAEEQIASSERKIITEIKQKAIELGFIRARSQLESNLTENSYKVQFDQSIKMIKTSLSQIKY